ncbi:putative C6 transcription factor [Leptodontidium sp. MPI-SDFR-AT-0119]|nr:putative C6 transcription factor [Leptodontidium sp. MPI-SDFR-AT-0119]
MDRRGKVSRGCKTCKTRRIRKQYSKAGWVCPRYGDVPERLFQNRTLADFTINPSTEEFFAVNQRVTDRAINLFLASHVPNDTVFIRVNNQHPGFSASLNAAALAAYGNTVQSTSILTQARTHLGTAIRSIHTALASPNEAIKDSTVISIMLLATFEPITCKDQKSLEDCDMHTKGAVTIIELRGKGQFQSSLGLQLFVQICGDISRGCLQRSVRVPAGLIAARSHVAILLGQRDPSWQLSEITIQVADFRAGVKGHTLAKANNIIASALELDASLSALVSNVPAGHRFNVLQPENDTDLIYGAYFWNNVRTCRLLLHQEIFRQTDAPTYTAIHGNFRAALSNNIIVHAHAVYSLFWPLLIVGQTTQSGEHRQWFVDRARDIGRTSGIHQAFALADVLERHEKIEIWED